MSFLNSPQWRKFQESVGRKTFDIGKGYAVKLDLPLGKSYLYSNFSDAPGYAEDIKKIAKEENAIFFRFEPLITDYGLQITDYGFRKSAKALQPQKTIILDIKKSEEEILAGMHSKTRYNMRLAKKRGIEVTGSEDKGKDIERFWELLRETAQRDKFYTHPKEYYKKLLEFDMAKLYLARKDGELHAAAIVIFYDRRATYLHGASDYNHRRDMAPHLLHWEIVQDAQKSGLEEYDLWGIDENKWPGMTRFKRGLGGREVEYFGSWDFPLQKFWYTLYKLKQGLR